MDASHINRYFLLLELIELVQMPHSHLQTYHYQHQISDTLALDSVIKHTTSECTKTSVHLRCSKSVCFNIHNNTNTQKSTENSILIEGRDYCFLKNQQNKKVSFYQLPCHKKDSLPKIRYSKTSKKKSTQTVSTVNFHTDLAKNTATSLKSDWGFLFLILAILFFASILKLRFGKKIKEYPEALVRYHQFLKIYRDQNATTIQLSALLFLLYNINMSIILFYFNHLFNWFYISNHNSVILLTFLALIIGYDFIFRAFNRFLAFVFEEKRTIQEYLFYIRFIKQNFAIWAVPFVVIYPFLDTPLNQICLYTAFALYLMLYIYRWIKGFRVSFKNKVPIFYMILYLCTLEIAPVILLYKCFF